MPPVSWIDTSQNCAHTSKVTTQHHFISLICFLVRQGREVFLSWAKFFCVPSRCTIHALVCILVSPECRWTKEIQSFKSNLPHNPHWYSITVYLFSLESFVEKEQLYMHLARGCETVTSVWLSRDDGGDHPHPHTLNTHWKCFTSEFTNQIKKKIVLTSYN